MRSGFIGALALCFSTPALLAAQQGVVEGRVSISNTSEPASGASVVLIGTRLGAISAEDGSFAIDRVPPGVYEVEVRRAGMTVQRRSVTVRSDTVRVSLAIADAPLEIAGITVVGKAADALARLPGSASVISATQLGQQQPFSANEALRTLPGVHLQEEEGVGLRANIGIRGLDPDRSRTVLVLEDGVPVALAPYGEPEMYYSPPIDRMERVEVVKGSGSVLFGPQTIGGVINYVTADAPLVSGGRLSAQTGSGDSRLLKARYGGTWGRLRGTGGAFQRRATDLNGLSYDVRDATAKVGLRTRSGDFGLKVSAYGERSNATYVGLTDSLYRESPFMHPQPNDGITVNRLALTGSHEIGLGESSTLRTNVYAYQTRRDWNRRDYSYGPTGSSLVFQNTMGSRNRSFDVIGIEPRLQTSWAVRGIASELEAGVRAHMERAREEYVTGTVQDGATGIRDAENRTGQAIAAFVQNRFSLTPSLHVAPGVRVEHFEFDRHVTRMRVRRATSSGSARVVEDVDVRGGDQVREVIPGIGTAWSPGATVTLFAGAHRGFAPPRTKDALIYADPTLPVDQQVPELASLQLDAERSWNYEMGTRLAPVPWLSFEATGFMLDFSNQIVTPSLSAGAVSQAALANQGATRHTGLELGASLDVGKLLAQPVSIVLGGNYTYVDASFSRDRFMRIGRDTVNVRGNRLPYSPRHKGSGSLTVAHPEGLQIRFDATHVGEQFADNFETRQGSPNGRVGLIPAYRIYDLAAQYRLSSQHGVTVQGSVKNLTDRTYIASRRPEGIRAGLPRLLSVGLALDF